MEKAYAAWRAFQDRLLAPAAALILLGCTLLALVEVVRRYVFGWSYEWQQDAVTFFTLSGVFLYFSVAQRGGHHLAVTLVPELFGVFKKPRAAEATLLVANAFSLVFMAITFFFQVYRGVQRLLGHAVLEEPEESEEEQLKQAID